MTRALWKGPFIDPNLFKNKNIYRGKEIRCLDSFVINQKGMKLLVDLIPKVNLPIDEHFDILVKQKKLDNFLLITIQ